MIFSDFDILVYHSVITPYDENHLLTVFSIIAFVGKVDDLAATRDKKNIANDTSWIVHGFF